MGKIRFTNHAEEKLGVLKRYGFEVSPEQVENVLLNPEKVISQGGGKSIAQRRISERHVLWVVYRQERETYVVITFYPGRRERYEDSI